MSVDSANYRRTVYLGLIKVDFARRRISDRSKVSRFSPKAAGVLARLMDAKGQVVSRNALLNHVWPNVHLGEEVLTQAIAELRRLNSGVSFYSNRQPAMTHCVAALNWRAVPSNSTSMNLTPMSRWARWAIARTDWPTSGRAVELNPSSFPARSFLAWALLFVGQNADALAHADAGEKVSPLDPASFHVKAIRAHALALSGQFEAAYISAEASDLHPRSSHLASAVAAWCAVAARREDRVKFHVQRLQSARPDFELSHYFALFPFEGETRETIAGHLRTAGL